MNAIKSFKKKKKTNCIGHDACMYIYFANYDSLFIQKLKLYENILPREIQKIVGNKYFFQLHLDEYNLKYGRENYTVSKILKVEISYKQNDSHKVEV